MNILIKIRRVLTLLFISSGTMEPGLMPLENFCMKETFIVLFSLIITVNVLSQEPEMKSLLKNEFGLQAGNTTGSGLSYRHWFKNTGIQATILPLPTRNFTMISAGLTGLYSFKETENVRFYAYLGNHLYYHTSYENDLKYNVGLGPGFSFGSKVAFNLMFGYAIYDVFYAFKILPTIEGGIYYKF